MTVKSSQQIFNLCFRDENGNEVSTILGEQEIINAVFDSDKAALRVFLESIGYSGSKLGSWATTTEYAAGDLVNYQGDLYKSILAGSGQQPDTSPTYWELYYGILGEQYVKDTWFAVISGQTGSIGAAADNIAATATYAPDEWPDGVDAIACGLDGSNRPNFEAVFDASGNEISVPTFTTTGANSGDYILSHVPTGDVAFVYRYRIQLSYYDDTKSLGDFDVEGLTPDSVLGTTDQITATVTENQVTLALAAAILAKLVTNGDSHDHVGGDGAQIAHSGLSALTWSTAGHTIDTHVVPTVAGADNIGSALLPFANVYFSGTSGTPGTNNFLITGASTSGLRTLTMPDNSGTVALTSDIPVTATVEPGVVSGPATGTVGTSSKWAKEDHSHDLGLTANVTAADGVRLEVDEIRARDGDGLKLVDDAGSGLFVADGGNVTLSSASNPMFKAAEGGSAVAYTSFSDISATSGQITKTSETTCVLDFDVISTDGTSPGYIRFFRNTNTTGLNYIVYCAGDGTSTGHAKIGVGIVGSYFQVGGGSLGIGTTSTPSSYPNSVLIIAQKSNEPVMPADTAGLYAFDSAGTCKPWAVDDAGGDSALTPHGNYDDFGLEDPDTEYPWLAVHQQKQLGVKVGYDIEGLIAWAESLSGQKFRHVKDIPMIDLDETHKRDWIKKWVADRTPEDGKISSEELERLNAEATEAAKTGFVPKAKPVWLAKRLAKKKNSGG